MYASVSAAGDVSEPFQVFAGVKQGCVLAPVLFNIFIAAVLRVFRTNIGEELNGIPKLLTRLKAHSKCWAVTVSEIRCADDSAFLIHTASGI